MPTSNPDEVRHPPEADDETHLALSVVERLGERRRAHVIGARAGHEIAKPAHPLGALLAAPDASVLFLRDSTTSWRARSSGTARKVTKAAYADPRDRADRRRDRRGGTTRPPTMAQAARSADATPQPMRSLRTPGLPCGGRAGPGGAPSPALSGSLTASSRRREGRPVLAATSRAAGPRPAPRRRDVSLSWNSMSTNFAPSVFFASSRSARIASRPSAGTAASGSTRVRSAFLLGPQDATSSPCSSGSPPRPRAASASTWMRTCAIRRSPPG